MFRDKFRYCEPSIDARDIKLPPFDASQRDESNGSNFILLCSLNGEKSRFDAFFCSFGVSKIFKASKLVLKGNSGPEHVPSNVLSKKLSKIINNKIIKNFKRPYFR